MHRALKYSLFLQREWTVLVESPTTSRDAGITALLPDGQIIQKDLFLEDFEFRWKKTSSGNNNIFKYFCPPEEASRAVVLHK